MIRKILPFLLTACLMLALTGCMGRNNGSSVSSTASATNQPTHTPAASASPNTSASPNASASPETSGTHNADMGSFGPFREALQGVYGEHYYPDTRLTEEEIRTELGLDDTLYEEVYAEHVADRSHPDTFIAVKVKNGKTAEVEEKLNAYKEKLAADETFAAHTEKINAAQVYSEGDYVFFLLTGGTAAAQGEGSAAQGETSGGIASTIGNDVQRGIDAIKKALGAL